MKVGIVGSRSFIDYALLKEHVNPDKVTAIVSGGAIGADTLAEQFAAEFGLEMIVFKPDYKKHGKAAPFIRNTQIVEESDIVFAFWDGQSTGTLDSINKAKRLKKPVKIVLFTPTTNVNALDC